MKTEKAGSKINRGLAICIYADAGTGKTTLATTLPENETLFINTEARSEEHTSELQSHSFISYAVFCLKKKKNTEISLHLSSCTQH